MHIQFKTFFEKTINNTQKYSTNQSTFTRVTTARIDRRQTNKQANRINKTFQFCWNLKKSNTDIKALKCYIKYMAIFIIVYSLYTLFAKICKFISLFTITPLKKKQVGKLYK